jgi:hypothetical protein
LPPAQLYPRALHHRSPVEVGDAEIGARPRSRKHWSASVDGNHCQPAIAADRPRSKTLKFI